MKWNFIETTHGLELKGATHTNGIVSFGLFTILILLILIFRKELTKYIAKDNFWYIYGGICIPFFVFGRYIPFIVQSAKATHLWSQDMLLQNIFATNLCPFLLIILSIIIMVPKWRVKYGKIIAPWAILGGVLNMFGLAMSKSANNFFMFFFFNQTLAWGDIKNPVGFNSYQFFSSHAWLLITTILILMTTKKYSMSDIFKSIIFIFIFALYVAIIIGFSHISSKPIQHDAGGILAADWAKTNEWKGFNVPKYPGIFKMLNPLHLKGAMSVLFGFGEFFVLVFAIMFMQYRFINFRGKPTRFKDNIIKIKDLSNRLK